MTTPPAAPYRTPGVYYDQYNKPHDHPDPSKPAPMIRTYALEERVDIAVDLGVVPPAGATRTPMIIQWPPGTPHVDPSVALGLVPPDSLPAIVDAADFMAAPQVTPPELVAGLLHKGSKMVLGGGSKAGKTWALLDLAMSVAHGKPWLGRETMQGPVLYVNFEIQDFAWWDRIAAVSRAKGIGLLKPGALQLWNLRGYGADFKTLLPKIEAKIKEARFALIVLDPIYKLYGGTDENSAGDVAELLNAIETLTVQTGAAVAYGAHFSKGNQASKEAIDRISGSGVFARDPDAILMFTHHEEENAFVVDSMLRNFAPVSSFAVRWDYPLFRADYELDPLKLKQSNAGRKREHDPARLLAPIAHTTSDNPVSVSEWSFKANVPRTTLLQYLPDMRAKDLVATAGEGRTARQYITAKGRALLKESTCRK